MVKLNRKTQKINMSEEKFYKMIAGELSINIIQVKNTIMLLDEDNTVPFISRYRKEHTGSLDEDQIRFVQSRIQYMRALQARKETILKSIADQGKLTPELQTKIEKTGKLQELEDLYLPYKPKKRTKATIARERGLEPLAQIIFAQEIFEGSPLEIAGKFINPQKQIFTAADALGGAKDIIAEIISENAEIRRRIREKTVRSGIISSFLKGKENIHEYEMYFDYKETLAKIPPHRILAINRGEKEGVLKVSIEIEYDIIFEIIKNEIIKDNKCIFYDDLVSVIKDSYTRLIAPAIHREIRNHLTENADEHAIKVFSVNLKNLLLQAPVSGKVIIGIDPGYRTGCKVAVIDKTGKYLQGDTIYPHPPQSKYFEAKTSLCELLEKYTCEIIAIGNGTASRETELMIAELISEIKTERKIQYTIVSEAGASVYSASPVAQIEFPDLEASMRGNISIARRLQDPLAELVKIDPKSIGVGLYQHDVNQKQLHSALNDVIENCVNLVGVDLNTASAFLLKYISGLTGKTASNIVEFRNQQGAFVNREQLKKVNGIGEIAFQQAAGFLRISGGDNPLDATSIHPESYGATAKLLKKFKILDANLGGRKLKNQISEQKTNIELLAKEIGCGVPTLEDILKDLEKPGRDPREEMPKPVFKSDVLKMEDLREGMILQGSVRNVVDFGAFVDIGVKQDGLVHISQMADKFVKSPHEIIAVGDIIKVKVLSIDIEKQRVALSMRINEK